MAESLPTSVSAFHHPRRRADSNASFSFYQDEPEEPIIFENGRPLVDDLDEIPFADEFEEEQDSTDLERQAPDNDYVLHRRASIQSTRDSVHSRLLRRDSGLSTGSTPGGNRFSQKIYMANEDLYIVIAGFQTSFFGLAVYLAICITTLGLGWLLFRWLPRWHIKLIGRPSSLRDCEWVVLEVRHPGHDTCWFKQALKI